MFFSCSVKSLGKGQFASSFKQQEFKSSALWETGLESYTRQVANALLFE
jgi:hypothetical protein